MAVPKTSQRAKLVLTSEQLQKLTPLAHSRTAPQREVQRARMLCHYHEGYSFTEIAALVHTTRRLVYECIDRALATGPEAAFAICRTASRHTPFCRKTRPGSCIWPAPSRRNWDMRPSCGRGGRWPTIFARWPNRAVIRGWRVLAKLPCSGFWTSRN